MRSRSIKPGFYKNEALAECSAFARLIFPGLWMMADREGRLECRIKRIKAELLPYDSVDVGPLLDELIQYGLVKKYSSDGVDYLWIPGFKKHQMPHYKEQNSIFPPHPDDTIDTKTQGFTPDDSSIIDQSSTDDNSMIGGQTALTPDSRLLTPDLREEAKASLSPAEADDGQEPQETGRESIDQPQPKTGFPQCPHGKIVEIYHEVLPELPRIRRWDGQRERHLCARWRETLADLKARDRPHDLEAGVSWFREFFLHRVRPSPLLMGKKGDWRASLSWLVTAEKFAKTLEGQYLETRQ